MTRNKNKNKTSAEEHESEITTTAVYAEGCEEELQKVYNLETLLIIKEKILYYTCDIPIAEFLDINHLEQFIKHIYPQFLQQ